MNLGLYGILILFGLFVLVLIINPNLSCFGRTIRSPFYPLFSRKRRRRIRTHDYGFHLVNKQDTGEAGHQVKLRKKIVTPKVEDYGFRLVDDKGKAPPQGKEGKAKRD